MPMSPRLLRPRASGAFDPRSIAGISAWYDASVSSSVSIGTGVSEWRDLSGLGKHLVQTVANSQPQYSTFINAKNAIRFDGSNDVLSTSSAVTLFGNDYGITMFVAFSSQALSGALFSQDDFSSPRPFSSRIWSGPNFSFFWPQGFVASSAVLAANVTYIGTARQDASAPSTTVLINGGNAGSGSAAAPTSVFNKTLHAGALQPGSSHGSNTIGELIFYARALSTAERQSIERYLGAKWGVTVA